MRKHIIALAALSVSCLFTTSLYAAEANTQQKEVSEQTIDDTVNLLASDVCHGFTTAFAKDVYECYEKNDENDPDREQCILADTYVMFGMKYFRRKLKDLGEGDYSKESPFMDEEAYTARFKKNMRLPRYAHLKTNEEQLHYFESSFQSLDDKIKAECKKNY